MRHGLVQLRGHRDHVISLPSFSPSSWRSSWGGFLASELSAARLEYNKVEHSIAITEWLLEHKKDAFQEIAALLKDRLSTRLESPGKS